MSNIINNSNNSNNNEIGENSEDECCLCGRIWDESCTGWPLCDTPDCCNTVCRDCAVSASLTVTDYFYCPPCSGSGTFAAATAGGSIASVVQVCCELETLPLSVKAIQTVCRNLLTKAIDTVDKTNNNNTNTTNNNNDNNTNTTNYKYRTLRLANPKVKELLDIDPCRRLLTFIGFVEEITKDGGEINLVKHGSIDKEQIQQVLDILEGVTTRYNNDDDDDDDGNNVDNQEKNTTSNTTTTTTTTTARTSNSFIPTITSTSMNFTDENDTQTSKVQTKDQQQQQRQEVKPNPSKRQKH